MTSTAMTTSSASAEGHCSLPPRVRGAIRGHVRVGIGSIEWSDNLGSFSIPSRYALRFVWWGEHGAGRALDPSTTASFPVRCTRSKLIAYLTDMRTIVFDLVDLDTGRCIADIVVDLLALLKRQRVPPIRQRSSGDGVPVISKASTLVGRLRVSLDLDLSGDEENDSQVQQSELAEDHVKQRQKVSVDVGAPEPRSPSKYERTMTPKLSRAPPVSSSRAKSPAKPAVSQSQSRSNPIRRHDTVRRQLRTQARREAREIPKEPLAVPAEREAGEDESLAALIARGRMLRDRVENATNSSAAALAASRSNGSSVTASGSLQPQSVSTGVRESNDELDLLYHLQGDTDATESERLFAQLFFDPEGYEAVVERTESPGVPSVTAPRGDVRGKGKGKARPRSQKSRTHSPHIRSPLAVSFTIDTLQLQLENRAAAKLERTSVLRVECSAPIMMNDGDSSDVETESAMAFRTGHGTFEVAHEACILLSADQRMADASVDLSVFTSDHDSPAVATGRVQLSDVLQYDDEGTSVALEDPIGATVLNVQLHAKLISPDDHIQTKIVDSPVRSAVSSPTSVYPCHSPKREQPEPQLAVQNGDLVVLEVILTSIHLMVSPSKRFRHTTVAYQAFADVPRVCTASTSARYCARLGHVERVPRLYSGQLGTHFEVANLILEVWSASSASSATNRERQQQRKLLGFAKLPLRCLQKCLQPGRYDKSADKLTAVDLIELLAMNARLQIVNPYTNETAGELDVAIALGSSSQMATLSDMVAATLEIQPLVRGFLTRTRLRRLYPERFMKAVDIVESEAAIMPSPSVSSRFQRHALAEGSTDRIPAIASILNPHRFSLHVRSLSGVRLVPSWLLTQRTATLTVSYRFPGEAHITCTHECPVDRDATDICVDATIVHDVVPAPASKALQRHLLDTHADIVFEIYVNGDVDRHLIGRTLLPLQVLVSSAGSQDTAAEGVVMSPSGRRHSPSFRLFVRPMPPLLSPSSGSRPCELDVAISYIPPSTEAEPEPQTVESPARQHPIALVVELRTVSGLKGAISMLSKEFCGLERAREIGVNVGVDIVLTSPRFKAVVRSTLVISHTFEPRFDHCERFELPFAPEEDDAIEELVRDTSVEFRVKHHLVEGDSQPSSVLLGTATVSLGRLCSEPELGLESEHHLEDGDNLTGWFPVYLPDHAQKVPVGAVQVSLRFEGRINPSRLATSMAEIVSSAPVSAGRRQRPFDCRVTVELNEIDMPPALTDARSFYVLYRFFAEPEATRTNLIPNPDSGPIAFSHCASFIAAADAEFCCYLRAQKLEVQLWAVPESSGRDFAVGSAFIDLSPLVDTSSNTVRDHASVHGRFEMRSAIPAHSSGYQLRVSISVEIIEPAASYSGVHSPMRSVSISESTQSLRAVLDREFPQRSASPLPLTPIRPRTDFNANRSPPRPRLPKPHLIDPDLLSSPSPSPGTLVARLDHHLQNGPFLLRTSDLDEQLGTDSVNSRQGSLGRGRLSISCVRAANVLDALHRPGSIDSIRTSLYVNFSLHPRPVQPWLAGAGGTAAIPADSHPIWGHTCILDADVLPSAEILLNSSFRFELWRRRHSGAAHLDERLLGVVEVKLARLAHRLDAISGWYDIASADTKGAVIGQLKVEVKPDCHLAIAFRNTEVAACNRSETEHSSEPSVASRDIPASIDSLEHSSASSDSVIVEHPRLQEVSFDVDLPPSVLLDAGSEPQRENLSLNAVEADDSSLPLFMFEESDQDASLEGLRLKMAELDAVNQRLLNFDSEEEILHRVRASPIFTAAPTVSRIHVQSSLIQSATQASTLDDRPDESAVGVNGVDSLLEERSGESDAVMAFEHVVHDEPVCVKPEAGSPRDISSKLVGLDEADMCDEEVVSVDAHVLPESVPSYEAAHAELSINELGSPFSGESSVVPVHSIVERGPANDDVEDDMRSISDDGVLGSEPLPAPESPEMLRDLADSPPILSTPALLPESIVKLETSVDLEAEVDAGLFPSSPPRPDISSNELSLAEPPAAVAQTHDSPADRDRTSPPNESPVESFNAHDPGTYRRRSTGEVSGSPASESEASHRRLSLPDSSSCLPPTNGIAESFTAAAIVDEPSTEPLGLPPLHNRPRPVPSRPPRWNSDFELDEEERRQVDRIARIMRGSP